jgi:hypothetical protein
MAAAHGYLPFRSEPRKILPIQFSRTWGFSGRNNDWFPERVNIILKVFQLHQTEKT